MNNNTKSMRFLALFAVGMAYGALWNPIYIRYIFYDGMLQALNCTNLQIATLNTIYNVTNLLAAIPGGWLADRVTARKSVSYSVLAMAPICVLSVLFSSNYALQTVVFGAFGLVSGFVFWPACLKAVRLAGTPEQSSTNFGIFEAVQGASGMIGNFIAIWLFSKFLDPVTAYKAAMLSMAAWCVLGGLLMLFCYKQGTITDDTITEKTTGEKKGFAGKDTLAVIKMPGTWLVGLIIFAVYGVYISQSYFTPYFTGVLGASMVFSAAMSNVRSYGSKIVGGPVGGAISNAMKSPSLFISIVCVIIFGLVTYISKLSPSTPNILTICTVLTFVLAFVCLMGKGVMWATMEEAQIPTHLTGSSIVIATYVGMHFPDITIPIIMGSLLDKNADNVAVAYENFFLILQFMTVVGVIACVINYIRGKRFSKAKAQAQIEQ